MTFIPSEFINRVQIMARIWEEMDLEYLQTSREILLSGCQNTILENPEIGIKQTKHELNGCDLLFEDLTERHDRRLKAIQNHEIHPERIYKADEDIQHIRYLLREVEEARDGLTELLEIYKPKPKPRSKTPKPELRFIDLFNQPYNTPEKIKNLKDMLRIAGIIDSADHWRTDSPENEISALYYYLAGREVISDKGSKKGRMKRFFQEFGKVVDEKTGPGVDTTRVNATKEVFNHPFTDEIDPVLKGWIHK